jgi:biotin operon repressor
MKKRRFTVDEQQLLTCLKRRHTGQRNAAKSPVLEKRFGVTGKNIREMVNALRCDGFPVCSDENGYYYAANEKELRDSIIQLSNRINGIAAARDGLLGYYLRNGGDVN